MTRRMWLLMVLLAALWGSSYLFIKVALQEGVAPVSIVFARLALGALVLVPIAGRVGALAPLRSVLRPVLVIAVVQIVIPFLLIAYGERFIASSQAGILFAATPIWAMLLAQRYDHGERPATTAVLGVVTGLVGVVVLLGIDFGGGRQAIVGALMVLLASAAYAIGSLYLKRQLKDARAVGVAAAALLTGALLLVPAQLFALPARPLSLQAVGSLLVLGVGGTGIAFAINYTLIAQIGQPRLARRLHRAGLRRHLRGRAARRAAWRRHDPWAGTDPRRLVDRSPRRRPKRARGMPPVASLTSTRAREES